MRAIAAHISHSRSMYKQAPKEMYFLGPVPDRHGLPRTVGHHAFSMNQRLVALHAPPEFSALLGRGISKLQDEIRLRC